MLISLDFGHVLTAEIKAGTIVLDLSILKDQKDNIKY